MRGHDELLFVPSMPSPPRDSVRELMEEREISPEELACQLELPVSAIEEFLCDKTDAPLTPDIAQRLANIGFGPTQGFWLRREATYRQLLAEQARKREIA